MANLITPSRKPLSPVILILLSFLFGIIYLGLGLSTLGFVLPSGDPMDVMVILLVAFVGWIMFLVLLNIRWKKVRVLSFGSHMLITIAVGGVSSVVGWPLFLAVLYSFFSRFSAAELSALCGFPVAMVALTTHIAYAFALRSLGNNQQAAS